MQADYPKVYLYRRIVQAKHFIDANYANDIALNNVAEEAFFSKYHFIRLFRKAYNKTPHQYLTFVRIEASKRLLQNGVGVADACYAVGFESIPSFTGLFKRSVGITPSAFRVQQQQRKADVRAVPLKFIPGCFAAAKAGPEKSNFEEAFL